MKKCIVAVIVLLLLVAGGAYWMMGGSASEAQQTTDATKSQVSQGAVTKAPDCGCPQRPKFKNKAKRKALKDKTLVVASKKKSALIPAPVPASAPVPTQMARAPTPTPAAVKAPDVKVDKGMLDNVDIHFAKRAKSTPKEEETVTVVSEVVVIEKPAKFYPAVPSNYNTCQFLYGSYRCDNPSYGSSGTSYVQPYAPQRYQPVAVPRYVSAPAIRTSPTTAPAITTAPQSIATR